MKAQVLKIDAISQANAAFTAWARVARELIGGELQHVTPSYTTFIDVSMPKGNPRRIEHVANAAWYNSDGFQIGTVPALIQFISQNDAARNAVLDNTSVGNGNFYVELTPQEPWFADLPEGGQAQILRIGVGIQTLTERVPIETASALSDGKVFTLASAALAAGTFKILVHESPDGMASIQSNLYPKKP